MMGRPKRNIFADAAEARDKEQTKIEYEVVWEDDRSTSFKKLAKADKVPTTVILSRANHLAIKRCSVERGVTFSELINRWIEQNCAEFLPKA